MEIDLYKTYIKRFGDRRKLNLLAGSVKRDESEIFYGLFRILMACDAVHDFCGRGFIAKSDDMLKFVTQLTVELKNDLNVYNLVDVCEDLIRQNDFKNFKINYNYFSTESNSKSISKRILNLFGLSNVPLKDIGQGDCTGDNSIIRMVKILNRSYDNNLPVELRVDATSNSSSLIPIYSSILEQSRRKASRCESYNELLFVKDISSEYDAANKDKLQKTLIEAGIVGDINKIEDTNYNIYCTVNGQPVNIANCGLKSTKSGDKIIVTLNVTRYFNKDCSDIKISNDLDNNSVKKLTQRATREGENHYKYSVFKTMGDFLQIVSFLDSKTYNKLYISFDILSSEICSLFSKFSFYEANESKERQNLVEDGLYVYMTDEEINDQLVASGLMFLQQEGVEFTPNRNAIEMAKKVAQSGLNYAQKVREAYLPTFATPISKKPVRGSPPLRPPRSPPRGQLKFGKKPKVSIRNTSTRVLKAKLKSVGVPVTKVVRGKRMKLTRKQLEMRAQAFKRLQLRCQKEGISLTYVSKNGRKYKSAKRLLNDMKRKSKPKKNVKPKMKWG